jgi:CRP-like cAMP-binding protein
MSSFDRMHKAGERAKKSDEIRPSATLTTTTPITNIAAIRRAAVRELSFEAPMYERFLLRLRGRG